MKARSVTSCIGASAVKGWPGARAGEGASRVLSLRFLRLVLPAFLRLLLEDTLENFRPVPPSRRRLARDQDGRFCWMARTMESLGGRRSRRSSFPVRFPCAEKSGENVLSRVSLMMICSNPRSQTEQDASDQVVSERTLLFHAGQVIWMALPTAWST